MKNIYVMRHGQTLFNVQGRTQGWCDSPLTEKGIADTQKAGQFLRNFPVQFDAFYSSTQERACDTLEIIFPKQAYQRLKGLKELNFGQFEGHPQYLEVRDKTTFFKDFGGETFDEVADRMLSTFGEIAQETEAQNIFCVSHGAALWATLISIFGYRPEELAPIQNLEMIHFTFDEQTKKIGFKEKISTL
ncbi:histidine phosphatase family protein [Lactococcus kimchii]|uniref:histidine phosphatase family protein n=1 Tax=Lactococcus sp. S-13 TaxID=2507158 RepID=UPI001023C326|nr:histidine phosphatase family protein [Lactococcus sp. S-13]RZI49010.1 histidine phosphatase family protein [Lactococcus sp. S-13]